MCAQFGCCSSFGGRALSTQNKHTRLCRSLWSGRAPCARRSPRAAAGPTTSTPARACRCVCALWTWGVLGGDWGEARLAACVSHCPHHDTHKTQKQMLHSNGQTVYPEVEGLSILLGYRTANAGCCKVWVVFELRLLPSVCVARRHKHDQPSLKHKDNHHHEQQQQKLKPEGHPAPALGQRRLPGDALCARRGRSAARRNRGSRGGAGDGGGGGDLKGAHFFVCLGLWNHSFFSLIPIFFHQDFSIKHCKKNTT